MIVIIGRAGAGKTVQGQKLAEELNYAWVSPGALLREKLSGDEAKRIISGQLYDDKFTFKVLLEEFEEQRKNKDGIILEGFPRSEHQAQWLVDNHQKAIFTVDSVIHLLIPKEQAVKRLVKRARPDDHESAINRRFGIYEKELPVILEKLATSGLKIHEINATSDVETVHQEILEAIK